MMKDRLSNNVILIQYPVNEGVGFNSIIDVLKMKMLRYPKDGGKAEIVDIPADQAKGLLNCMVRSLKKQLKAMKLLWNFSFQMILSPRKK